MPKGEVAAHVVVHRGLRRLVLNPWAGATETTHSQQTMRVVAQRVTSASVTVDGQTVGRIEAGLLLLVAFTPDDTADHSAWMASKLVRLRIFDDARGVMNCSVLDTGGSILTVSQFTLYGDVRKGTRPSYVGSAPAEVAEPLYLTFLQQLESLIPGRVAHGTFGAHMQVQLENDGPVTIIVDR